MARYEHLQIYKSVYDMNLYFYKLSSGFAKDYKYGLGQEIRALLSELLDSVIIANNLENKSATLKESLILVERIKHKTRLLADLRVMKLRSYEYFSRQMIEISKQFEKWKLWADKGR